MPNYEVTVEATTYQGVNEDKESYEGVLVQIRPPVDLNPDAVVRYFTHGDLDPYDPDPEDVVKDVVLIGSSEEQTTIYASVDITERDRLRKNLGESTVRLMGLMKMQATLLPEQQEDIKIEG
jgi:hypothetical protein